MVKYKHPLSENNRDTVISILKKRPELIDYLRINNLEDFFSELYFYSDNAISSIVQFLYESDVDVLSYIDYIPKCAFIYKPLEAEFIVPGQIKKIDKYAFMNSSIKSLKFEEGSQLIAIEGFAFYSSDLVGDIYLPDSLESLYLSAFEYTKVKTISLPSSCVIKDYSDSKDKVVATLVIR